MGTYLPIWYVWDKTKHHTSADHTTSDVLEMRNKISITQLVAMYRVGHKYNVQHLWNAASRRLHLLFPTTSLQQWRTYNEGRQSAGISHCQESGSKQVEELGGILALIREFPELANIAALVLYACCQLPIEAFARQGALNPHQPFSGLAWRDINTCFRAIPQLRTRNLKVLSIFASSVTLRKGCHDMRRCDKALLALLHDLMQKGVAARPSPLEDIVPWCEKQGTWKQICTHCQTVIRAEMLKLRLVVWNDLEKIFDVPTCMHVVA